MCFFFFFLCVLHRNSSRKIASFVFYTEIQVEKSPVDSADNLGVKHFAKINQLCLFQISQSFPNIIPPKKQSNPMPNITHTKNKRNVKHNSPNKETDKPNAQHNSHEKQTSAMLNIIPPTKKQTNPVPNITHTKNRQMQC